MEMFEPTRPRNFQGSWLSERQAVDANKAMLFDSHPEMMVRKLFWIGLLPLALCMCCSGFLILHFAVLSVRGTCFVLVVCVRLRVKYWMGTYRPAKVNDGEKSWGFHCLF